MPYVSEKQRKFFHANKEKLEEQGVNVAEWDKSSKGKKLPKEAAILYTVLHVNNMKRAAALNDSFDPRQYGTRGMTGTATPSAENNRFIVASESIAPGDVSHKVRGTGQTSTPTISASSAPAKAVAVDLSGVKPEPTTSPQATMVATNSQPAKPAQLSPTAVKPAQAAAPPPLRSTSISSGASMDAAPRAFGQAMASASTQASVRSAPARAAVKL